MMTETEKGIESASERSEAGMGEREEEANNESDGEI